MNACLGFSLYISFPPSCDGSVSVFSLSARRHFPSVFHLKSIRCHFFFSALTCTPVALAAPVKIFRPFCASFNVSSRWVSYEGATCMILEPSTKQYPTRWKESCEMLHLNTAPRPACLRHFRRRG